MAADDADGEKSTFGCLDAARYAVAAAVSAIIVVVIVYAVVVVLRPGELTLKVAGSHVPVAVERGNTSHSPVLTFVFTVLAINPSGRVRIFFTDIIGSFSGQINGSGTPEDFIMFQLPDISVEQQSFQNTRGEVAGANNSISMTVPYFNLLYEGGSIPYAMLKLNGTRIVEKYSGHNSTAEPATVYYCPSLTVGGDPGDIYAFF